MVRDVRETPPRPNNVWWKSHPPIDLMEMEMATLSDEEVQPGTLDLILTEQRKTNELLLTLIEALSEDQGIDEDQQPVRHLDGTLA